MKGRELAPRQLEGLVRSPDRIPVCSSADEFTSAYRKTSIRREAAKNHRRLDSTTGGVTTEPLRGRRLARSSRHKSTGADALSTSASTAGRPTVEVLPQQPHLPFCCRCSGRPSRVLSSLQLGQVIIHSSSVCAVITSSALKNSLYTTSSSSTGFTNATCRHCTRGFPRILASDPPLVDSFHSLGGVTAMQVGSADAGYVQRSSRSVCSIDKTSYQCRW